MSMTEKSTMGKIQIRCIKYPKRMFPIRAPNRPKKRAKQLAMTLKSLQLEISIGDGPQLTLTGWGKVQP